MQEMLQGQTSMPAQIIVKLSFDDSGGLIKGNWFNSTKMNLDKAKLVCHKVEDNNT